MSWCVCPEWEPNVTLVNAPNALAFARNPSTYKGYQGVPFRYCPWCGRWLDAERPAVPQSVPHAAEQDTE